MSPLFFDDLALFRQKLSEESKLWEAENLLSPEQRDAILLRYENAPATAPTETVREFPLYIRIVLALAVFMVGLAVFLLISFNWQYLSGTAKLSIVGSVLATAHAGGFLLRKKGWKNWADVAFFFAGIMFGVGIWQIGQVFHLPANWPVGLWLWAMGAFLLASVVGSTSLHLLSVALLVAWTIAAMTGSLGNGRIFFFGLVPFSAWSLPLFAALGIAAGFLKQNRFVSTLYALILCFWWILQGIGCGLGPHLTFHIVAVGLLCIAGASLRIPTISKVALERVGILLVLGGLLSPSFLNFWGWLLWANIWNNPMISDYYGPRLFWAFAMPMIDLLIVSGLIIGGNRKTSFREIARNNKIVVTTTISVLVLWIGSYSLALTMNSNGGQPYYYHYVNYDRLLENPLILGGMLAVNALIVLLTIGMIQVGLKRNRSDWFWSGVLFFLLWAVIRYIDLFSGVGGMLGAATIFLFCGVFMFGIVYVWTTRRGKHRMAEPIMESFRELTLPPWMTTIRDGLSERNILTAILIVAVLQFAVLGALIGNEMRPHFSGTTIRVTTVPVDPRDLFRGDYVILRYEFSDVRSLPGYYANRVSGQRTVYVIMRQEGELWKPVEIHRTKPKEGVFLRGTIEPYGEIVYGIESYFVQEGAGKTIEDAMRRDHNSVVVELTVAPNGKASIKTVHVDL